MNEAKTVLFAISMDGMAASQAKAFEEKTMFSVRSGSRDYFNANSIHCDYKDGLMKMCQQYRPSAMVVNELLSGMGNIFDIVREIKSEFSDINIVILLKDNRVVGDAVLANLAAAGIYNWLSAPWKPEAIASLICSPKKLKDVEAYIPKIIEKANGLAFDTKLVERVEDKLEDLAPTGLSGASNAVAVDEKMEDLNQHTEEIEVDYHQSSPKKVSGFGKRGFGKSGISLSLNTEAKQPVEEVKKEEPVVPEPVKMEVPKPEPPKTPVAPQFNPRPVEEKKPETKTNLKLSESRSQLLDRIGKKKQEEFKAKEKELQELKAKEEKLKEEKLKEIKKEEPKPEVKQLSLNKMEFSPKYKKVLFVRALPLSTVLPLHIAKLSNATFVDFNKESCYDGFDKVYKTTIKEAKLPDDERIVADVVAGNGLEKIIPLFDLVIVIVPEDDFVIKTFNKRYPDVANFVLVHNPSKLMNFKILTDKFGKKLKFISFLSDDVPMVYEALNEKKLLMDNSDYAKGISYIVKKLNNKQ